MRQRAPRSATLTGHQARVTAAAFSPDGKRVSPAPVTTRQGCGTRRPEPRSRRSEGHSEGVGAVAFSPDGKRVLTGSSDNTARLWDAATGAAVATLTGHTGSVNAVAFSPDGKRVLTGSEDSTARLWDAATGPRSRRSRDTQTGSMQSPSRPTASAFSLAPRTARRGCGTPRPAPRSRRSRDTKTVSGPSRFAQRRAYCDWRRGQHGAAVGRRDRRRGRVARGTHSPCSGRRLLARRQTRCHRLRRRDGKAVDCLFFRTGCG